MISSFLRWTFTFLPTSPINVLIGVLLSSINCDTLPIAKHAYSVALVLMSDAHLVVLQLPGSCGLVWYVAISGPSGLGVGAMCVISEHLIVGARVSRAFSFILEQWLPVFWKMLAGFFLSVGPWVILLSRELFWCPLIKSYCEPERNISDLKTLRSWVFFVITMI